jgi:hypothetical protein
MTTNGARTVRYYDDIAQFMSYIVMSYHPSFEDPELVEKAYACGKHTSTTMSIMFDSRHFDKSLAMYNRISEEGVISVEPVRIHDWNSGNSFGRDYTPEQIAILESLPRKFARASVKPKNPGLTGARAIYDDGTVNEKLHAQNLINTKQTNFQHWDCMIGLESLYVKWDGMIRSGNCITSEVLGQIQDIDAITWPTQPWVCRQNFCNCTTDVYVSKRKNRG